MKDNVVSLIEWKLRHEPKYVFKDYPPLVPIDWCNPISDEEAQKLREEVQKQWWP